MRIGFIAERKTRGKANKIELPTKLPTIRLKPERLGKITGYKRHDIKIKKVLIIGIARNSDS